MPSGMTQLSVGVDGSIVVRDEEKLEKMRFNYDEMKSLAKMLDEQPPAPKLVRDMCLEHIIGVDFSTRHPLTER